jgi:hypothetical protein
MQDWHPDRSEQSEHWRCSVSQCCRCTSGLPCSSSHHFSKEQICNAWHVHAGLLHHQPSATWSQSPPVPTKLMRNASSDLSGGTPELVCRTIAKPAAHAAVLELTQPPDTSLPGHHSEGLCAALSFIMQVATCRAAPVHVGTKSWTCNTCRE